MAGQKKQQWQAGENSGCLRGDTCPSGVSVMSDTQCEDLRVTLRMFERPHHVYLSTRAVILKLCVYVRCLCPAPVGLMSL